jgi:hypothetical protein
VCKDFDVQLDIDLFANDVNTKCSRFFSATYCPGTLGVDAFNYHWKTFGLGWNFVPPTLVLRCIRHMYISGSEALVLVPQWKSSVFYVGLTGLYDTGHVIR